MNEKAAKDIHMATDPVCGMMVDPHAGKPTVRFGGGTYFFCSEGCRTKFAADPERYLGKKGEPEPLPAGTLYTCPMHPQIVQEGPGTARSAAWRSSRWGRCPRTPTIRN